MFFDFSLDLDLDTSLIRGLRQKVRAIREDVFEAVKGPIRDAVQEAADAKLAVNPGDVIHPFEFATPTSAAWDFWARRKRIGKFADVMYYAGQNDESWLRTGDFQASWAVSVNTSANEGLINISNTATDAGGDEYAAAVLGPDQVPGHEMTGWGAAVDEEFNNISVMAEGMIDEAIAAAFDAFDAGYK